MINGINYSLLFFSWTTWTVGAVDPRVIAIIPIVMHIGPVAHFVDVGVTRNVKGCQKLQSGWPTHFVDQHIC